MARKLSSKEPGFEQAFAQLLEARETGAEDVRGAVEEIIASVREEGDAALCGYTRRFDRWEASPEALRVSPAEITQAVALVTPEVMASLKAAAQRIAAYSARQLPQDVLYTDEAGVQLGWKWSAVDAVGLYVPGGKASYPSSVLMNAVPAKTAGVSRLAMVVPAPDGVLNLAVLAAAQVAGVDEIYKIGGAQAVAALAYGTASIAPVDKIVGPGNAYVAEAKRQVFGRVGIDMIAGPSEILVVADANNDPAWVAADLLSQAEHDELAQAILMTDDAAFAQAVERAVEETLARLPRRSIAERSWREQGGIITVGSWEEAVPLINRLAPEHLELMVENPQALLTHIRHAGAVFLGRHTPEAIGDYIAGPSHVLPTSRTARFASGLSVLDFVKRTSLIGCDPRGFSAIAHFGGTLAEAEGLSAHALSLSVRNAKP